VEHVALVDLEPPVQHVDAQEAGLPGDELVDVVEQLLHLVLREQPADDQEAVLPVVHVLLDADRCRRRDIHDADGRPRQPWYPWPQCSRCCLRLIRRG
jgi:hypothetical protein